MAVSQDRMKASFWALVKAAIPRIDYFAFYHADVIVQSADLATVDVVPLDPRLPSMAGIPLVLPAGGFIRLRRSPLGSNGVAPGVLAFVGWAEGDPAKPFATLPAALTHQFLPSNVTPEAFTLAADTVNVGGPGATPTVVEAYRTAEAALNNAVAALATTAAGASIDPAAATFFTALAGLLTNFEAPTTALTYLSTNAKVK